MPVGCVIVNRITKKIESEAHNETNISRNVSINNTIELSNSHITQGTRHCEIVALEKLINKINYMNGEPNNSTKFITQNQELIDTEFNLNLGNFYDLFVTVEPCIMCIGFIDQLGKLI